MLLKVRNHLRNNRAKIAFCFLFKVYWSMKDTGYLDLN